MKRALVLILLSSVPWPDARADDPPQPQPPRPTTAVPLPEPVAVPAPAPAPREAKARAPKIVLGEKHTADEARWAGAGVLTKGKFEVKASGPRLTAVVTGAADSHAFFGKRSATVAPFQLVQEFEVVAADPDDPQVVFALSVKLDGYLRTEPHSAAWLRQADAAVYPACGGNGLGLTLAPCGVSEGDAVHCSTRANAPLSVLPAGRYVLVVNLVVETTAGGAFRGHSVAVFAPDINDGTWRTEAEEIDDLDDEEFGLSVTLKTAQPSP